jgi:hypothetical protein
MPAEPIPHPVLIARLKAPEKHFPNESANVHAFSRLLARQFEQIFKETPGHVNPKTFTTNAILLTGRLEAMHDYDLQATLGIEPTELADARNLFGLEHEDFDAIVKSIPRVAGAVASSAFGQEVQKYLSDYIEKRKKPG